MHLATRIPGKEVLSFSETKRFLEGQKIELAGHTPYSPDLAPNDFYSFPSVKNKLRGQRFSCREEAVDDSDIRKLCGLKENIVTRIVKGMLEWLEHLERTNESRLTKQIYRTMERPSSIALEIGDVIKKTAMFVLNHSCAVNYAEDFFSRSQPHNTRAHGCAGVRMHFIPPSRRKKVWLVQSDRVKRNTGKVKKKSKGFRPRSVYLKVIRYIPGHVVFGARPPPGPTCGAHRSQYCRRNGEAAALSLKPYPEFRRNKISLWGSFVYAVVAPAYINVCLGVCRQTHKLQPAETAVLTCLDTVAEYDTMSTPHKIVWTVEYVHQQIAPWRLLAAIGKKYRLRVQAVNGISAGE
ncbi:hypothetical protein EVAR_75432_1 [Eumeta japonica]|uniref:Histone-lysine N-methyltransferase SETMAR n=1 Tax=Eumeta variegata TaxID=151549 RepID=A0A4C1TLB4_EUMVA|nr:hypothetical protein EVAR_75432_1 [Eumeta japonica]